MIKLTHIRRHTHATENQPYLSISLQRILRAKHNGTNRILNSQRITETRNRQCFERTFIKNPRICHNVLIRSYHGISIRRISGINKINVIVRQIVLVRHVYIIKHDLESVGGSSSHVENRNDSQVHSSTHVNGNWLSLV